MFSKVIVTVTEVAVILVAASDSYFCNASQIDYPKGFELLRNLGGTDLVEEMVRALKKIALVRKDCEVGKPVVNLPRQANKAIRNFAFTLNNPVPMERDLFEEYLKEIGSYWIIGDEIGKLGTPHYQGYCKLKNVTKFLALKKGFNDRGWLPHIGDALRGFKANVKYCKKDGDWKEYGNGPKQGERTDVSAYLRDAQFMSSMQLATAHANCFARYYKAGLVMRRLAKAKKGIDMLKETYLDFEYNAAQSEWWRLLQAQNDRQILWIADPLGGSGKTTFGNCLIAQHGCFYFRNGSQKDIAFAFENWEWDSDYVFFDLARCQRERVNYGVIEAFKDGKLFSPKYESQLLIFKPKKLIVCANFYPDKTMLSRDRWQIIDMNPPPVGPRVDLFCEDYKIDN